MLDTEARARIVARHLQEEIECDKWIGPLRAKVENLIALKEGDRRQYVGERNGEELHTIFKEANVQKIEARPTHRRAGKTQAENFVWLVAGGE